MRDITNMNTRVGEKPCPKTGATNYHAQLVLLDKERAIKGFVVYNIWNLEPLDLINSLALNFYQPFLEV